MRTIPYGTELGSSELDPLYRATYDGTEQRRDRALRRESDNTGLGPALPLGCVM